jgi:nitrogen fixation protein NifU and related proteins
MNYLDMFSKLAADPLNRGRMKTFASSAKIEGPCGDTMEIFLEIKSNKIIDIKFDTDGCDGPLACGSAVTDLTKNLSIEDALSISPNTIIQYLGGIPEKNIHCIILTVNTLHQAISEYLLKHKKKRKNEKTESGAN